MGPARGLKKRRKVEKKPEENASASSEKERSIDWWDELSRKMNGTIFPTCFLIHILGCGVQTNNALFLTAQN
ncbi:hypothetical protein ES332_D03G160800v1 [Gossypium tomentosum]|uniref:Uncharacterized protein n=1 Tax=Gossypium tomentosum TaxID=34277 RepID=A0A5D2LRS7_GOSTO|nr:hypothetical protein ES332_D03G160800v1 [Gossypium tomentosum]